MSLRHQINPDLLQEASLQTKMANNKKEAETALSSNLVLGMFWISSLIQFGEGEWMPSPQSLNSYRLQKHIKMTTTYGTQVFLTFITFLTNIIAKAYYYCLLNLTLMDLQN